MNSSSLIVNNRYKITYARHTDELAFNYVAILLSICIYILQAVRLLIQ